MQWRTGRPGLPLLLAALAACGSDSSGPSGTPGTFTITVDGSISRTFTGETARFGVRLNSDGTIAAFDIEVTSFDGPGTLNGVGFSAARMDRPPPGTYQLVEFTSPVLPVLLAEDEFAGIVVLEPLEGSPGFSGTTTDGSITITSSSEDRISGTFVLTADGNLFFTDQSPQSGSVTMTGEFVAAPE